jgi:hypothetical protein
LFWRHVGDDGAKAVHVVEHFPFAMHLCQPLVQPPQKLLVSHCLVVLLLRLCYGQFAPALDADALDCCILAANARTRS